MGPHAQLSFPTPCSPAGPPPPHSGPSTFLSHTFCCPLFFSPLNIFCHTPMALCLVSWTIPHLLLFQLKQFSFQSTLTIRHLLGLNNCFPTCLMVEGTWASEVHSITSRPHTGTPVLRYSQTICFFQPQFPPLWNERNCYFVSTLWWGKWKVHGVGSTE